MKELIEDYRLMLNRIDSEMDSLIGRTNDMSKIQTLKEKRTMLKNIISDLTKLQDKQISPPATAKKIVITFE